FHHPRRWRVAGVRGTQIHLDSADGSGILITVEPPARVPTGAQFLAESRGWLLDQKARVMKIEPAQTVRESPPLEHFSLAAEVRGKRVLTDYYVTNKPAGGATLAARLLPNELAALQLEIERLARSVELTPRSGGQK